MDGTDIRIHTDIHSGMQTHEHMPVGQIQAYVLQLYPCCEDAKHKQNNFWNVKHTPHHIVVEYDCTRISGMNA